MPLRRRSGTAPDGPEASPAQTGASPEPAGAGTAAPSAGTPRTIRFRRHAPDDPVHQQRETCGDGLPPARPGRSGRSVPRHRPPRRRHRPATRREWTWMRPVRL